MSLGSYCKSGAMPVYHVQRICVVDFETPTK